MEREPAAADPRLVRAARSLARNRALQVAAERRIEQAEASLRGYLYANSLTKVRLGAFQVELVGEDIRVTRLTRDGWRQLSFREGMVALAAELAGESNRVSEGVAGGDWRNTNDDRF